MGRWYCLGNFGIWLLAYGRVVPVACEKGQEQSSYNNTRLFALPLRFTASKPGKSLGRMHTSLLLSTVSLLQLGAFTFAHNADHGFHVPGVFGGRTAMRHLPRHMIEKMKGYPASAAHLQRRGWGTSAQKKCGPGVGHCDPGDWYVNGKKSFQSKMKANCLIAVRP